MKTLTLLGAMVLLCPFVAKAQNNCSQIVNEGCSVAQPIALHNVTGLQFGRILSGANAGLIAISATGAVTPTTDPGGPAAYTGTTNAQPHTAATFWVSGEPGFTYGITTPLHSSVSIGGAGGGTPMTVDLNPAVSQTVGIYVPSGTLNVAGTTSTITPTGGSSPGYDAWAIGATLHVGASQPSGAYTGTFSEQVTYQ